MNTNGDVLGYKSLKGFQISEDGMKMSRQKDFLKNIALSKLIHTKNMYIFDESHQLKNYDSLEQSKYISKFVFFIIFCLFDTLSFTFIFHYLKSFFTLRLNYYDREKC